ncbi:hypothetical protein OK349_19365 [Sphingomonas sp. BT-65]|uniref:hypothetical protein n=1 Tax=Sphingomonas sp. BT-65 TaxID=2989821 RepID=UPI002235D353|nr:hypothetical protein [Sphingomonas sp. BT-65]MCW4463871.1 hypothetical protein [Sphingomonas sp. BT-65]
MAEACEAARQSLHDLVKTLGGELSSSIKEISDRYEPEFDRIRDDAPDAGGVDAALGIEIDVEWETIGIALDLPEVTMKTQEWSLDLPQVTMKDKRIVFHTPSIRMVRKKIGQRPEVHGWTIKWKNIHIEVPEPFMQKHEIVMGIPDVRMDRTSFKLDVPEFAMRTQELKFDVPQITVKRISIEAEELREKAEAKAEAMRDEIAAKRAELFGGAREQIVAASSTFFTCLRTQIQMKRDETAAAFEPGLAMVRQALSKLEDVKAGGEADAMRQRLADLTAKRDAATVQFDEAVRRIVEQEKATVDALLNGLRDVA